MRWVDTSDDLDIEDCTEYRDEIPRGKRVEKQLYLRKAAFVKHEKEIEETKTREREKGRGVVLIFTRYHKYTILVQGSVLCTKQKMTVSTTPSDWIK